uniref:Integral membrane protein n=2 Tax=Streptomyces auratus AGR0001 TaxID=1160718 RepID=J2K217_9ACTN
MSMNSAQSRPDSSRANARPALSRTLRRRPAVVLALLAGLLAAAIAPAAAAGRAVPDTARVVTTASAPGHGASVRAAAAPARSAASHRHATQLTSAFKVKKSKWKSKARKKGGFFKKLGIFLVVLFILFLVVVILVIWLIVRFFRRAGRNRRND